MFSCCTDCTQHSISVHQYLCPWDNSSNAIITIATQAHDRFVPHWCVADWWMRSTIRARESCHKTSLSPNVGASHAQLQPGIGAFLQPFGSCALLTSLHRSIIHLFQLGTVNTKTLAASMPSFNLIYQLSIVVKWHWRDTVNWQLILFLCRLWRMFCASYMDT